MNCIYICIKVLFACKRSISLQVKKQVDDVQYITIEIIFSIISIAGALPKVFDAIILSNSLISSV